MGGLRPVGRGACSRAPSFSRSPADGIAAAKVGYHVHGREFPLERDAHVSSELSHRP